MRALLRRTLPRWARVQASAALAHADSARLDKELAAIAASGTPIVAGPWLGEVGFELLYWVPFLAWAAARTPLPRERLVVISRGGTASWYAPFAGRYADVFEHVTPEGFRDAHDARVAAAGEQKQTSVSEFERRIVEAAAARAGIGRWTLLHPSRMYQLFNPYWWGHLSPAWVHRHADYRVLDAPHRDALQLPSSYVAAKFYFNDCFPPTAANRAFMRDVLARLASKGPVVALSTGLNIDDHHGDRVDEFGVLHLPEGIDPAQNLAVQSAAVAGARAFVGTYGGFSYLAPFYRVPSYAFYSDPAGFSPTHLAMARSAFERIGESGLLHVNAVSDGAAVDVSGAAHG